VIPVQVRADYLAHGPRPARTRHPASFISCCQISNATFIVVPAEPRSRRALRTPLASMLRWTTFPRCQLGRCQGCRLAIRSDRARQGHHAQVSQIGGLSAVFASQRASGFVIAAGVEDQYLRTLWPAFVAVGPGHQRRHHPEQVTAFWVRWYEPRDLNLRLVGLSTHLTLEERITLEER
jgi:hypothetical protein